MAAAPAPPFQKSDVSREEVLNMTAGRKELDEL
jgi:hypothetical protein